MHKFKDREGTEWEISLDIGKAMRIAKEDSRFSLLAPQALLDTSDERSQLQMRLADIQHVGMFFELLCLLCEKQAKARNIEAEAFSELVTPKLIEARRAFFDEWRDFSQSIGKTGEAWMLETLIAEMEALEQGVAAKMNGAEMKDVRTKARSKVSDELNRTFGNLQDLLEPILTLSPAENSPVDS